MSSLGREQVIDAWNELREAPTWQTGSQTLELWLNSKYSSLTEITSVKFNAERVFEHPITRSRVIVDLAAAMAENSNLRIWSSAENCISKTADAHTLIES